MAKIYLPTRLLPTHRRIVYTESEFIVPRIPYRARLYMLLKVRTQDRVTEVLQVL